MGHLLLQQPLLHHPVLSTARMLYPPLLLHGKYPFRNLAPTSVVDPSSPLDSSCLPATANKPSELMLLWEPPTAPTQRSLSEVPSPAIHNTPPPQALTTITQSSPLLPTSIFQTTISLPLPSPTRNTQLAPSLKSPDGERPTVTSTKSQPNSKLPPLH